MKATATKIKNGYRIELNGQIVRKCSKRLFDTVYVYRIGHQYGPITALSDDSQLRRCYGDPVLIPVELI